MEDRRTAYHEAGHWVVAVMLGVAVDTVTIEPGPEDDWIGKVDLSGGVTTHQTLFVITVAGGLAELEMLRRTGRSPTIEDLAGAQSDIRELTDTIGHPDNVPLDWWELAGETVHANWDWIDRLALALLERRTLTCDEAWSVLRS